MALASLAGNTVVAAATTDVWEAARRKFARLLGRGDPQQEHLAEQRLEETRQQLTRAEGADLERARARILLQQIRQPPSPTLRLKGAEADLRALVDEIRSVLPAGVVSAADHAIAAGRDVNISASGGGMAVGVVHGNVASPDPLGPGPVQG